MKDRTEYFRQYNARRLELKWPRCNDCGVISRKLSGLGCLECLARTQPRREWGRLETDMIETHAGKDDPAYLQLRIYQETGQARTRYAIKTKWSDMGIDVLSHQGGYTIPELSRLTGRSRGVFMRLIESGEIQNLGRGRRNIVSMEDGEKLIARFKSPRPESYTIVEAARVLGCTRRGLQGAIDNGVLSWKEGMTRYVCKATIDRAVAHLRETGYLRVQWRQLTQSGI